MCFCLFFSFYLCYSSFYFFFFNDTATTEIYTLSLHDAPSDPGPVRRLGGHGGGDGELRRGRRLRRPDAARSEEHTSELQSHVNLVCRLLLEKKKTNDRRPLAISTPCHKKISTNS